MKPLSQKATVIMAVTTFICATALSLSLAYIRADGWKNGEEHESGKRQNDDGKTVTCADFEYKTTLSDDVKTALNSTDVSNLILANKTDLIGESFVPESLVTVNSAYTLYGKELQLSERAGVAAIAMIDEMRAEGLTKAYITSGYRSYSYQQTLFDMYYQNEKTAHPDWSDEQLRAQVLSYSAAPGSSEHQTGLCMDLFVSPGMLELENYGHEGTKDDIGFAETEEFKWLKENAHKFGFILRYPESKVDVTGYTYESWHYRFVGVDAATEIYTEGITLEEYLGK